MTTKTKAKGKEPAELEITEEKSLVVPVSAWDELKKRVVQAKHQYTQMREYLDNKHAMVHGSGMPIHEALKLRVCEGRGATSLALKLMQEVDGEEAPQPQAEEATPEVRDGAPADVGSGDSESSGSDDGGTSGDSE